MLTLHLLIFLTPGATSGREQVIAWGDRPGGHHSQGQSVVFLHSLPLILEEGMGGKGPGGCQASLLTSFLQPWKGSRASGKMASAFLTTCLPP